MANTFSHAHSSAPVTSVISSIIRGNVLRVGLVLAGVTMFIAAAEASTPVKDVNLTNLPQLVSQIANQSARTTTERSARPYVVRRYQASDDYAATVAQSNLINSPAARFLAERLN